MIIHTCLISAGQTNVQHNGELILVLPEFTQDPEMSNLDPRTSKRNISNSYQEMPSCVFLKIPHCLGN